MKREVKKLLSGIDAQVSSKIRTATGGKYNVLRVVVPNKDAEKARKILEDEYIANFTITSDESHSELVGGWNC